MNSVIHPILRFLVGFVLVFPSGLSGWEKIPEEHYADGERLPVRLWKESSSEAQGWRGPFASALPIMFGGGLPDPSGLPYHRIKLVTGNCNSGYDGAVEAEGWLINSEGKETGFVIAWNGLVYPVVEDLGQTDIRRSLKRMMNLKKEDRASWLDNGEQPQVSFGNWSLIHGLYLTRMGFAEEATSLLKNRERSLEGKLLLEELAAQWVWNHFDRGIGAHMRGDCHLALASFSGCRLAIRDLSGKLQLSERTKKSWSILVKKITSLEEDNRRRLKEGKSGWFDPEDFLSRERSVAELVSALDRIALPQNGQPGDVPLWTSSIVRALVARGEESVEPLLSCLSTDRRLTRSVHFWRSHHRSRTVLGVHEAALYALQALLGRSFFELASTGDSLTARDPQLRVNLALMIRKEWEKYGKATGVERAYRILKDDEAGVGQWWDAALTLFPEEEYDEEKGEWVLPKGPIPGEPLRKYQDPSVAELLSRRAAQAGGMEADEEEDPGRARLALLSTLNEWDPVKGKEEVTRLFKRWLKDDSWEKEPRRSLEFFVLEMVDSVPEALLLFEVMAWTTLPEESPGFGFESNFVTQIYSEHSMRLKRKDLWTNPESPWCLQKLRKTKLRDVVGCWRERKLLKRAPFRELILTLLSDATVCGQVLIDQMEPNLVQEVGAGGYSITREMKVALKPGESFDIRRMDVVGKALGGALFHPDRRDERLEFYWSLKDRDAWLENLRLKLKQPGAAGE